MRPSQIGSRKRNFDPPAITLGLGSNYGGTQGLCIIACDRQAMVGRSGQRRKQRLPPRRIPGTRPERPVIIGTIPVSDGSIFACCCSKRLEEGRRFRCFDRQRREASSDQKTERQRQCPYRTDTGGRKSAI